MLLKELAASASPLNEQQVHKLTQVAAELSVTQLAWVSGYFYGISQHATGIAAPAPVVIAAPAGKLTTNRQCQRPSRRAASQCECQWHSGEFI